MRRHSYRAGRAELLFKVKRHNQALAKSRINSDAFSLHMRYESAIRFRPKDTYALPRYRNANSSGTTLLATDFRQDSTKRVDRRMTTATLINLENEYHQSR